MKMYNSHISKRDPCYMQGSLFYTIQITGGFISRNNKTASADGRTDERNWIISRRVNR